MKRGSNEMHSLRQVCRVRRRRRRKSVFTRHSCLREQSGSVVNSASAWESSNSGASSTRFPLLLRPQEASQPRRIETKSGQSVLIWSLKTDARTWTTCLDACMADMPSDLKKEREKLSGHMPLLSHQTWRSIMLNPQSELPHCRPPAKGILPGQMAVKDAFNQELQRSRTNGGYGLVVHRQSNCSSCPSHLDAA